MKIQSFNNLPENWKTVPLKSVAHYSVSNVDKHSFAHEIPVRLCNYTDVYKNDFITLDMPLMKATATEAEIEKFHLEIGDVVITKDSETWNDIAIPTYISETADDLVCGYHLGILRANRSVLLPQFLFRLMQSRPVTLQLELESKGVTRVGLPKEATGSATIPLPPLETQQKIADFLDRETARIDDLISEKKHMLKLLKEKRSAVISQAVTQGLNPSALMKDSGTEWIGMIPEHWESPCIKHTASIGNGSTPRVDNTDYWANEKDGFPWLNSSTVNDMQVTKASRFVSEIALKECHLPIITPPAILVGITGQGRTRGKATLLNFTATINQHVAFLKPNKNKLNPEFLQLILTKAYHFLRSESDGAGSTKGAITCEQLSNIKIALPPLDEQNQIVLKIKQQTEKNETIEKELKNSIILLNERRSALITAAVTGQITI